MNRETLYAAVFAKFAGLTWTPVVTGSPGECRTTSRKLLHWNDVPSEQCPALFQVQVREVVQQVRGFPTKWALQVELYLYVKSQANTDSSVVPSKLLNPFLDAVTNALRPDNQPLGTCTLDGLVSHAWINDAIETSEGNLGDTEVAIVPIELLVPYTFS